MAVSHALYNPHSNWPGFLIAFQNRQTTWRIQISNSYLVRQRCNGLVNRLRDKATSFETHTKRYRCAQIQFDLHSYLLAGNGITMIYVMKSASAADTVGPEVYGNLQEHACCYTETAYFYKERGSTFKGRSGSCARGRITSTRCAVKHIGNELWWNKYRSSER
jgi:hypothetical protein